MKKIDELRKSVDRLRELGEDWTENMAIIKTAVEGNEAMLQSIKHLCKKSDQSNLVKIGLTLLAFPLPIVVDDVLGLSFLAVGLIQRKMKNSALHLEDVNNTFSHLVREFQEIRQETVYG